MKYFMKLLRLMTSFKELKRLLKTQSHVNFYVAIQLTDNFINSVSCKAIFTLKPLANLLESVGVYQVGWKVCERIDVDEEVSQNDCATLCDFAQ